MQWCYGSYLAQIWVGEKSCSDYVKVLKNCGSPSSRPQACSSFGERTNTSRPQDRHGIMRHLTMLALLLSLLASLRSGLRVRAELALENHHRYERRAA
jgi:hypothetical protein